MEGWSEATAVQGGALTEAQAGIRSADFHPFIRSAPLTVMVRSSLEWLLAQSDLEAVFAAVAHRQYTRELTLELLVQLMLDVACGIQPSAHAAYRARQAQLCVSFQALYGKLQRMEPTVGAAVVAVSGQVVSDYIHTHGLAAPEPVPGYRARIVDGTVLAGHDHRLQPLRGKRAAGLTGMALAVFSPAEAVVRQVVLAEDAYTQERALLAALTLEAGEVWLADRNFCVRHFLARLVAAGAAFVIRWHARTLPFEPLEPPQPAGAAHEQRIRVVLADGSALVLRRIVLPLPTPTRSGDTELILVTNLPTAYAAASLAAAYRARWRIETHYQRLTELLHCELPGLGYPRAALFAFAMAVTAANALALVIAALRQAHAPAAVEALSLYRLVDEVAHTWRGMMIALPPERWAFLQGLSAEGLGHWLTPIARAVPIHRFQRSIRKTRNPPPKKPPDKHHHYSNQRLLDMNTKKKPC